MRSMVERNLLVLGLLALGVFAIGAGLTTILPPLLDRDMVVPRPGLRAFTEQELRGMKLYRREGCVYCHTQQIRALEADRQRYGWRTVPAPSSESWEYANQPITFLGSRRTGPDLARVGGKYSSEWHWAHFRNPRDMAEKFRQGGSNPRQASVMPSFDYLTDEEVGDLTAYIQTLGRQLDWRQDQTGRSLNDYEE